MTDNTILTETEMVCEVAYEEIFFFFKLAPKKVSAHGKADVENEWTGLRIAASAIYAV